ncbi:MAG TPA: universal stress protein [Solirubrobacteraceae bacterium]|nr:universal stress protein [Solirubrobacteraceae bacterium]
MFRNVFVGVDGTPNGRDAIALAGVLAEPGARLTLAHVHGGPETPNRVSNRLFHGFHESSRGDSLRLLEAERDATGVSADLITAAGSVGGALHRLAEEHEADLVVVGSCSRGVAGRVMLGDHTRDALNGARCAVAIAPQGYAAGAVELETVGVGYDFNDESHVALSAARDVAARHDARVSALHVVAHPIGSYASPMPSDWGRILEEERQHAADRLHALEGVDASAVYGAPFEELAAFGDQVDLLVVGSRSYGPLKRLVLGSTSAHLTRHAHCALLVIPRAAVPVDERSDRQLAARAGATS